jgi:hypothetical protein
MGPLYLEIAVENELSTSSFAVHGGKWPNQRNTCDTCAFRIQNGIPSNLYCAYTAISKI